MTLGLADMQRQMAAFADMFAEGVQQSAEELGQYVKENVTVGGVLCDRDIIREVENNGSVVIIPFNKKHLGSASYDVTLGENYYVQNAKYPYEFFCPWDPQHRKAFWEDEPRKAEAIVKEDEAKRLGVQVGDKIIVINPGETILAHTQEFIGGRRNVTTMMHARSSMGRSCITVCKCAGSGDIGFISRYTMEIQNTGPHILILIVGQRLAQIIFFSTGEPINTYEKKGNYQKVSSEDVETLTKTWKPSDMLPQTKRDEPKEEKKEVKEEKKEVKKEEKKATKVQIEEVEDSETEPELEDPEDISGDIAAVVASARSDIVTPPML